MNFITKKSQELILDKEWNAEIVYDESDNTIKDIIQTLPIINNLKRNTFVSCTMSAFL